MSDENALEMKGICKEFPGVRVLNNVDFRVKKGEIHALIGENGAGKSTLIKILSGAYHPDAGEIIIHGKKAHIKNPDEAIKLGVAVNYQEIALAPNLSAIENVLLGHEVKRRGFINRKANAAEAEKWLNMVSQGLIPDYNIPVGLLSVAQQQMIEIAKSLSLQASIIVLDEPTASLSDAEIEVLFRIIRQLKANGITIIYISHRLEELFLLCESVTVLRDGNVVDRCKMGEIDRSGLIKRMIGREMDNVFPERHPAAQDEIVLEARGVKTGLLKDVSFDLRRGEILGVAGLVGSGRTELMRAVFGADKIEEGEIILEGNPVSLRHPKSAVSNGIGFATEDRKDQGLFLDLDIKENVSIAHLPRISRRGIINLGKENNIVERYIAELKVATTSSSKLTKELSGGNQQKVVLAKWLATGSKILILDEPTRGIDVGAKYEIYLLMDKLAKEGISIIMVSSELPEVLAMSDRVLVMHEGKSVAVIDRKEAEESLIMHYAMGQTPAPEGAG